MKKILLLLLIFVSGCTGVVAQQFDYGKIAPHPRLLLPAGGEEAIRKAIAEYPPLATVHQRIMELCDRTLTEPPVERIKEGKRLLAISRIALKRIYYLSYAYRMTGDKKYAHRAEQEMLAVSRFTDWNPTHFLDVGEMVMALAIGYDWLYDSLQPDTRRVVREAIIAKGFDAAKNTRHAWFYTAKNNWNSVCNSGLAYGALALFEEIPEVSKGIIEKCMETNPKAMVGYGPDGGYPEGFGYWGVRDKFSGNAHCCARKCFRHRQWALPSPRLHGVCPFHAVYDGSGWRLFLFLGFSGRGGVQHDDVLVCRQSERPFPVVD